MSVLQIRSRRRDRTVDEALVDALCWSFREACAGVGVCQAVDAPIAGTSVRTPEVTHVRLGPPCQLTVRMLPGQLPSALARVGRQIGPHLGGIGLRVEDRGHGWAIVTVLTEDPLAGVFALDLPVPGTGITIGLGEDGLPLVEDWRHGAHTIVQGVTRSGKSVWTYGVLAQLAAHPDTLVAGCDPTGLLWRPFAGSRHADWQVSGLADVAAHERLLARLVVEMDARVRALPLDRDTAQITRDAPMIVVVLEEYPGLLRALDAADRDTGKRIRALLARLLAESAKVGMRVVILAQRAEAAVIGAFERAMCSWRISFRTDNRATVELLHPGVPGDLADAHTTAAPGIALMSAPGRELARIRAPYLGGYAEYVAAITAACRLGSAT
jgi:hypothetical protein